MEYESQTNQTNDYKKLLYLNISLILCLFVILFFNFQLADKINNEFSYLTYLEEQKNKNNIILFPNNTQINQTQEEIQNPILKFPIWLKIIIGISIILTIESLYLTLKMFIFSKPRRNPI